MTSVYYRINGMSDGHVGRWEPFLQTSFCASLTVGRSKVAQAPWESIGPRVLCWEGLGGYIGRNKRVANLRAVASSLRVIMASNLRAMASNLRAST